MVFCLRSSSVNDPFPSWLADLACHVSKNGKKIDELLLVDNQIYDLRKSGK